MAMVVAFQTFFVVAGKLVQVEALGSVAWTKFVEDEVVVDLGMLLKMAVAVALQDLGTLSPLNCPIRNAWFAEAEAEQEEAVEQELTPLLLKVHYQVEENGAKHLGAVPAGKHW